MSEMLIHAPEHIIAKLLIDRSLATDPASIATWPVQVNSENTKQDETLTVSGTEGKIDGRSMPTGEVHSHPSIQVLVKGRDQTTARAKAKAIAYCFDQQIYHQAVTLEGIVYCVQSISRTSTFNFAGKDRPATDRNRYTINAYVTIKQNP